MDDFGRLDLSGDQRQAVLEFDTLVKEEFMAEKTIIFGSTARGDGNEESDLDLLIILHEPPSQQIKEAIWDLAFDINLKYETNISTLIVERKSWHEGLLSVTPLHSEVERDGIPV